MRMTRISTATKRKLNRIRRRHELVSSTRRFPVTSPFFQFDAAIRIAGVGMCHESILSTTGISPSRSYLAGDKVSARSSAVRKEDLWILTSPLSRDHPIEEHISWLLETVSPHMAFFARLVEKSTWADLCLGCLSDIPYPMIVTDKSATQLVKMLNLSLSFNFTCR